MIHSVIPVLFDENKYNLKMNLYIIYISIYHPYNIEQVSDYKYMELIFLKQYIVMDEL